MHTTAISTRNDSTPVGSILVPIDGSVESRRAIAYAAAFAPRSLLLLRVLDGEPPRGDAGPRDVFGTWRRNWSHDIETELGQLASECSAAAPIVETEIRYGSAAERIIEMARGFDLVVMTSHGRGTVGRSVFGSVADRVVRHGSTPTLVVRLGEYETWNGGPSRLVVPLDGSELAEHALPLAARVAATVEAPLHLVRVVGMEEILATVRMMRTPENIGPAAFPDADPYEVARVATEREAETYLAETAGRLGELGYEVTTEVRGGTPAFELAWASGADDLVVMTSRGQGGYQRWLIGSVAEKLLRESNAPVLMMPINRPKDVGAA